MTGGLESQVFITVDPTAMAEAGVSQQQLLGVLQANELTVPSGQLNSDGQRDPSSTIGELTSVDQISQLIVGVRQTPAIPGATPDPNAIPIPVTSATSPRSRSRKWPRPATRAPTASRH